MSKGRRVDGCSLELDWFHININVAVFKTFTAQGGYLGKILQSLSSGLLCVGDGEGRRGKRMAACINTRRHISLCKVILYGFLLRAQLGYIFRQQA
jgi:hypothetical protein